MKTLLKRGIALLLALLCLPLLPLSASAALLTATDEYYVADYARVLSRDTCQLIIGANGALRNLTGGQVVVATVEEMEGFSPEEYAARLFDDWAVGDYSENNGMLLLLAVGEARACLYVGSGLKDRFDEATRDQMLDTYFRPDFENGNYDSAVRALFPALIGWYEQAYGVSVLHLGDETETRSSGFARFAVVFSIVMLALLFIAAVLLVAIGLDKRRYRSYYYGMGVPMPRYRPYFFFFGGPHRSRHYRRAPDNRPRR